jgi:beta-phosphoglucomutase-like phosphatase (HAD superfamily)
MKAIIFDCDGTLVDSDNIHYEAWCHALQKHGYDFLLEEDLPFVGVPSDTTGLHLARKIGKNCGEELRNDKRAFYKTKVSQYVPPIQDTLSFVHKLVQEQSRWKYKLAVASGAPRYEIELYLRHLEIDHIFDFIVSGKDDLSHYQDAEGTNKPKPYIYLEAAKRLGLDPKECIAIEDSCPGVMSSSRAGCLTIAIPTAHSLNHDFSAAHLVINSLKNYSVDQFFSEVQNCTKEVLPC